MGGVGWVSGGRLDRSSESDDLEDPRREYSGRVGDEGEAGDVGDCGDSVPDMLVDLRCIVEKSMCSCDGNESLIPLVTERRELDWVLPG